MRAPTKIRDVVVIFFARHAGVVVPYDTKRAGVGTNWNGENGVNLCLN